MTYRVTLLNILAGIYLIGLIIYTLLNYKVLASGEGWGVVSMVGLAGVAIAAAIVDLVLQQFIKNRQVLNLTGLALSLAIAIALMNG